MQRKTEYFFEICAADAADMENLMNLPNKLTVARAVMIPVFLLFFFLDAIPGNYVIALLVFAIASITDMIDGKIARSRNLITDFGKLMDPLADKLLVMAAMVSLASMEMVHAVVVIIILAREFIVTAVRQIAAANGTVIAADKLAKLKTIFQMIWICYDLAYLAVLVNFDLLAYPALQFLVLPAQVLHYILIGIVTALTMISGVNYIWKNKKLFADA